MALKLLMDCASPLAKLYGFADLTSIEETHGPISLAHTTAVVFPASCGFIITT
jgi:hypothetical protein